MKYWVLAIVSVVAMSVGAAVGHYVTVVVARDGQSRFYARVSDMCGLEARFWKAQGEAEERALIAEFGKYVSDPLTSYAGTITVMRGGGVRSGVLDGGVCYLAHVVVRSPGTHEWTIFRDDLLVSDSVLTFVLRHPGSARALDVAARGGKLGEKDQPGRRDQPGGAPVPDQ